MPLPRRRHQAGNLGVEHAAPDAVQRALATSRPSQPERKDFDREDLVALGLFTPMGAAQAEAQVTRRISRHMVYNDQHHRHHDHMTIVVECLPCLTTARCDNSTDSDGG